MKKKYIHNISIATILAFLILTPIGSASVENSANLELTDLTGTTFNFTYTQLMAMPKTEVTADLYCDGALVTYGIWGGVSLNYLLNQAQFSSEVYSIQFTASDGYHVAIPLDLAIEPQIIIAYELNDQPLAEGLRLVIPDANGAAWIAWITSIFMSNSGAAYPQAISVGAVKQNNIAPTTTSSPQPTPIQQEIPIKPQPSTPDNSSSITIQEETPINDTQPTSQPTKPQASNQGLNMQATVYLILAACTISFTLVVFMIFIRKRKRTSEKC